MLRPESLSILDDGAAADNVIAAQVERIDVTGPAVRIYARTPFGIANARWPRKPGAPALSVGANLRLGFSATDCALFSDVAASGQRLRIFSVVDSFTRECLALEVDTSMPSRRITRALGHAIAVRGRPVSIRSDNGPEMSSRHYQAWCIEHKIDGARADWSGIRRELEGLGKVDALSVLRAPQGGV